ncbi:MAG: 16S rRNA (cytosine(967)-C(5))-methyltransferase RsmB [candidate division WOR-3 bacterium]|nr:MAG: 16S rRNA (cytosine(967)-C(5))-methyltransferase RsmB [candidate division WOR-3 bacterium]
MTAREAALNALCEVDEGKNVKDALASIFENNEMKDEDRQLANELAFGTLRHREEIDQIIRETLTGDFFSLDSTLKNVLRIAVYQYLFFDRIPIYAIVNEAVNFGRNIKEKGLINAVLRGVIRNKRVQVLREPRAWVFRKIIEAYQVEGEKIIDCFKIRPTPYIRINLLKNSVEEAKERLRLSGLQFREANWFPEFKSVDHLSLIINSPLMKQGYISIHDEAQGLVCHLVDPKPGEKIIDLCSAPGSKATYMAEMMKNEGMIVAVEISNERLKLVVENALRLGIQMITPVIADGRYYKLEEVDKILVDAPCTNAGVIAKRPEVKDRVNKKVVTRLAKLQYDLLTNAATLLRKGGSLIYSTCSILPDENEDVIALFLKDNPNFVIEPAKKFTPLGNEFLKILPCDYNTDGVFAARLKKTS